MIECAYTNEPSGDSVQLSNERKLFSEAGSDTNKFAMEVLFRAMQAAGGPCPSGFSSMTRWEVKSIRKGELA